MDVTYPGEVRRLLVPAITGLLFIVRLLFAVAAGSLAAHAAGADDYRLAPGDTMTFDFLDDTELPVTLTITSDGAAQFPLIGDVRIAGLTVSEALAKLRETFKTQEILKDPKIALNVTTFRPIFVLGEVKSPGSFAYFPGMNVEQAIGLAGGYQTAITNPSDRIIARARLRGEIDGADVEIAHEAIYAARLAAQLAGRPQIDLNDVPEIARNYVQPESLKSVIELEQKILDSDLSTSKTQVEILSQGIKEAEQGLQILDQLQTQQKEVVELNEKELERVADLRQRELNTASELLRAKSSASDEKARMLEIIAEMSQSRRELGNLRLQLAQLQAVREKDILTKLQERDVAIKKLIASRQSAEEQFFLMATVAAEETKKNTITYLYQIRRDVDGKRRAIEANTMTDVFPGDVVSVSIAGI